MYDGVLEIESSRVYILLHGGGRGRLNHEPIHGQLSSPHELHSPAKDTLTGCLLKCMKALVKGTQNF